MLEVSARSGQGVQEGLTKMLDEVTYYDRNGHSVRTCLGIHQSDMEIAFHLLGFLRAGHVHVCIMQDDPQYVDSRQEEVAQATSEDGVGEENVHPQRTGIVHSELKERERRNYSAYGSGPRYPAGGRTGSAWT